MINRAARQLEEEHRCEARELPVLAFASQIEQLGRFERYERHALAKRKRALRDLAGLQRAQQSTTALVRRRELFVEPVTALNVNALVKAARAQAPHASLGAWLGTWICPGLNEFRVAVRFDDDHAGALQIGFASAAVAPHDFVLVRWPAGATAEPGQWSVLRASGASRISI